MQTSYQGIRQQLVSLTVELEDKCKVTTMLETKVKQEREMLQLIEHEIKSQYDLKFQQISTDQEQIISDQKIKINQLIENKKNILEKCKQLVEEIKTLDNENKSKLQELTTHAKQVIEQDKKTFKSNSEERQKTVRLTYLYHQRSLTCSLNFFIVYVPKDQRVYQ